MVRKLVIGMASAWLVFMPMAAHALGFGNIKLNSSLNEPLNADIALISASQADLGGLKVKLASPDAFLRAGIDRPHFLTGLKFEPVERDGNFYIHVSSRKPIREPFVNFLLEMTWDNGRMLREYTMLLDPPGRLLRQQAPAVVATPVTEPADTISRPEQPEVVAPAVAMKQAPAKTAPPEPVMEAEPVMPESTKAPKETAVAPEPEVSAKAAAAPMAVEEVAPMQAATEEEPEPEYKDPFVDDGTPFPRIRLTDYHEIDEMVPGELDYGVTKKGDNAWTIAKKLQQGHESVSIYQVMMALLKSNPDAFVDGNIHRLKTGQVLRIEDPSLLTAMSQKQAANKYIAQTDEWNSYRQAAAERTGQQPIVAGESTGESMAQAKPAGELTLSSPDGSELQSGAGASEEAMSNDLVALKDELRQVRAGASTMRERNAELNQKLRELEDELARLQRSVSVKDDELAALQQQLAQLNAETAAKPEEAAAPVPQPKQEAAPAEQKMAEAQPEATPMEKPAAVKEEAKPAEAKPQPKPKPEAKAKPKPAPVAAKPKSEPKGMVDEYLDMAKGIFDSAMEIVTGMTKSMTKSLGGNSLILYVAVPVLLVLLILMMIVVRRRKKAEGSYQESILSGGPSTVTSEEEGAEAEAGESSFLSDFAVSGAGAIQTEDSEVDPLTEADVFMAYGRYEAAEERLQEAITKDPSRKELKLKLLELYNSTKNSSAFETLAEDFYASLGDEADSDPMWAKVLSMGKELAPGNPLFAAGVAAMATADVGQEPVSLSDSQVMDIGLETGVFQSEDFAGGGAAETAGSDMDFNLDFGESTGASEASAEAGGGMDFNLDLGGETAEAAGSDMDFNLDMGIEEDKTPTQETETLDFNMEAEAAGSDAGEPDFSLDMGDTGGLSLDTGDDTMSMDVSAGEQSAAEEPTMALDTGELEFDTGDQGGGMDFDLGTSDSGSGEMSLGGGDEVGTKLDLAKAYIDMGDPDGARSILDEVLDEGNDSQKQEAQQLIQQIA